MRKYWVIFKICLIERFTYRTDFMVSTLMRFLPIVTTIFLWKAVFAGTTNEKIAGLTSNEFVAYYLLAMVGRAFSSMPGLASSIASDVRTGNLKKYLTQPVDLIGFYWVSRLAHKMTYYAMATIPFAIVFALCGGYFPAYPRGEVWVAFVASLLLAFVLGFLFELILGLVSFWTLEIGSILYIVMTLNYILSGHMFPLDLIPPGIFRSVLDWLPFQYFAYFPAKIYLHGPSMSHDELLRQMTIPVVYSIAMAALAAVLYRRGLRRYSAFGG